MLIYFFSCSPNVTLATDQILDRIFLHYLGFPSGVEINSHYVSAAPWAGWLIAETSCRTPGFDPNPVYMGFVIYRMKLSKAFL